jgi:hypothetical protein
VDAGRELCRISGASGARQRADGLDKAEDGVRRHKYLTQAPQGWAAIARDLAALLISLYL